MSNAVVDSSSIAMVRRIPPSQEMPITRSAATPRPPVQPEKGELLPILQLLLGSAVIGDGDCGRRETRAGERYKLSADMEVDRGVWCIVNEGDVGEDRM